MWICHFYTGMRGFLMAVVNVVLPVIVMLALGVICRMKNIISTEGMRCIKKYITAFALPVTIFHAIATANFNESTVKITVIMLIFFGISFTLGFLCKGIVKDENIRKFFPFLIIVYECGMLGYPLYQNLCGAENLGNIAVMDIAGGIFGFGIFFGVLQVVESGKKLSAKLLLKNCMTDPCFIALILGIILGVSGLMDKFITTDVGILYVSVKNIIVAPLTALILLNVGYDFTLSKEILGSCIKTLIFRVALQAVGLVGILLLFKNDGISKYQTIAFCLYFFVTPSFALTSYSSDEKGNKYFATTVSLYTIVTIVAYTIIAIVFK